jgi:hypothetical protein
MNCSCSEAGNKLKQIFKCRYRNKGRTLRTAEDSFEDVAELRCLTTTTTTTTTNNNNNNMKNILFLFFLCTDLTETQLVENIARNTN